MNLALYVMESAGAGPAAEDSLQAGLISHPGNLEDHKIDLLVAGDPYVHVIAAPIVRAGPRCSQPLRTMDASILTR